MCSAMSASVSLVPTPFWHVRKPGIQSCENVLGVPLPFDLPQLFIEYRLESYVHRPRVSRGGRKGSARGLPVHPPREERTKHETKPRRNLRNLAFSNNRVFMLLIAFVFVGIAVYCSALTTIPKRLLLET